jgi:penicillin-binding protein 1C
MSSTSIWLKRFTLVFAGFGLIILLLLIYLYAHDEFSERRIREYDISRVINDRYGNMLNVHLSNEDEWCIPVSLDRMGLWTARVVVALEDGRFFKHSGVDLIAIGRALASNLTSGRIISGASTITSQIIRISHPRQRTILTKSFEFISALKLERIMTKDEILELYLNRAPFGGNIRGVEAAARVYFNKNASSLSLAESTLLIALLKSPSRLRPDRFPERAKTERNRKLDYLLSKNIISPEMQRVAVLEDVRKARYPIARRASMASAQVIREAKGVQLIHSTIDSNFQLALERNIYNALTSYANKITAAGIILDNASGEVLAYVGNARHGASIPGSQVDCGNSPRSPGSTLKPFAYAIAFEKGLLTPSSLLADTPISFRGSPPRNFNRSYRGPVSARVALASSLNVPAVRILRTLGYPQTLSRLKQLGFSGINENSFHYADSLILGGCEVTLIELANAYRTLANLGKYSELSWLANQHKEHIRIYSAESAYITGDILYDERRLTPLYREIFKKENHHIAFKTGTSHGLWDAWSVGFSKKYTVCIWLGVPSGEGNASLVGMIAAAPIMLGLFRELDSETIESGELPNDVYKREVCALSGAVPNKYCPTKTEDLYIRDVSKTELCKLHSIESLNGIISWPKDLELWMRFHDVASGLNPKVKILRPVHGSKIILHDDSAQRINFEAEGAREYFWYLDGKYLGTDTGRGIFASIKEGEHRITVLAGNESDSVSFKLISRNELIKQSIKPRGIILD